MSTIAGKAKVIIGADIKGLQGALKRATKNIETFASSVKDIGLAVASGLKTAGFEMMKFGAVMSAPFVLSGRNFASFEKQMANVATMLREPEKHMDNFNKSIKQMAIEFGVSTEILSLGLYDILSASIPPEKALAVLAATTKAAAGGMTDVKTATDATTTILNAYGLAADNAAMVTDFLQKTVVLGKTNYQDLAQSIGMVASTAAISGLSLDELGAGLATITRAGVKSETAVVAMNNILKSFLNPTAEAAAAAKSVGLELNTATLKSIGFVGVMKKISSLDPEMISKIFPNIRALRGVLPAIQNLEGLQEALAEMQNKTGEANRAFDIANKTMSKAFDRVYQSVVILSVEIGQQLAPVMKEMISIIKPSVAIFVEWIKANGKLVRSLAFVSVGLVAIGGALVALGSAALVALGAFKLLALTVAILTSPVTILTGALGFLAYAFKDDLMAGISSAIGGLSGLGDMFKKIKPLIVEFKNLLQQGNLRRGF